MRLKTSACTHVSLGRDARTEALETGDETTHQTQLWRRRDSHRTSNVHKSTPPLRPYLLSAKVGLAIQGVVKDMVVWAIVV